MGQVISGKTFAPGETVTPTKIAQMFTGSTLAAFPQSQPASAPVTSATAYVDYVGSVVPTVADGVEAFSQVITPATATTLILILHTFRLNGGGVAAPFFAFFRGSTLVQARVGTGTSSNEMMLALLDNPATTSPVTYSMRFGRATVGAGSSHYQGSGPIYAGEILSKPLFLQIPG